MNIVRWTYHGVGQSIKNWIQKDKIFVEGFGPPYSCWPRRSFWWPHLLDHVMLNSAWPRVIAVAFNWDLKHLWGIFDFMEAFRSESCYLEPLLKSLGTPPKLLVNTCFEHEKEYGRLFLYLLLTTPSSSLGTRQSPWCPSRPRPPPPQCDRGPLLSGCCQSRAECLSAHHLWWTLDTEKKRVVLWVSESKDIITQNTKFKMFWKPLCHRSWKPPSVLPSSAPHHPQPWTSLQPEIFFIGFLKKFCDRFFSPPTPSFGEKMLGMWGPVTSEGGKLD